MSAPKDLTGQRFDRLVAVRPTEERRNHEVVWECLCDCGSTCFVRSHDLTKGHTKSCGCKRGPIDLTNQRFGKLVVIRPTEERKYGSVMWECRCDCGQSCLAKSGGLLSGHKKSCGCYRKEHGDTHKKLYGIWGTMKHRCSNPNNKNYNRYGARGIRVCDEWAEDYEAFRAWSLAHGYEEGKQLHRVDNDKGYSPDNCVWLSASEHTRLHATQRRHDLTDQP